MQHKSRVKSQNILVRSVKSQNILVLEFWSSNLNFINKKTT
jgi:hypothetical protein